jgi:hypothetical protein
MDYTGNVLVLIASWAISATFGFLWGRSLGRRENHEMLSAARVALDHGAKIEERVILRRSPIDREACAPDLCLRCGQPGSGAGICQSCRRKLRSLTDSATARIPRAKGYLSCTSCILFRRCTRMPKPYPAPACHSDTWGPS